MKDNIPRELTKKEMQDQVFGTVADLTGYWATVPEVTELERCQGLVNSIFSVLDGNTSVFPCKLDLVVNLSPEMKLSLLADGQNYPANGMVLSDNMQMHTAIAEQMLD